MTKAKEVMANATESESLKKKWAVVRQMLTQHPSLALTFAYFLVSTAGVAYSWVKFASFGVDFFDYAELSDFALAAFGSGASTIWAIGWCLGMAAFIVWVSTTKTSSFTAKKVATGFALVFGLVVASSAMQGLQDADNVRRDDALLVAVYVEPLSANGEPTKLQAKTALLGIVGESIFVFDRTSKTTAAIPMGRIHRVEYPKP